jgi:hypothetical protein
MTAIADGSNLTQKKAAADANEVQNAVNIVAIVGSLHRHLLSLKEIGVYGDNLINHPVTITYVSKLNSLCRMTTEREMAAFNAIDKIEQGETVEYEVIPL